MTKDSILSSSPNAPSADSGNRPRETTVPFDLHQAARQHLASLQDFGIQTLRRGSGEVMNLSGLLLADSEDAAPNRQASASATPTSATAGASASASSTVDVSSSRTSESARVEQVNPAASQSRVPVTAGVDAPYPPRLAAAQRPAALQVLAEQVAQCTRCEQLCGERTQTVFGAGDPNSRLVLVGEGPGRDEDQTGQPFVGAAGQLLNRILAACGLKRDDVYILNTVKCRPPQNRNPKPDELANCWPYGQSQLEILQPEFICCLGSVAARTVLNTTLAVGKLRKKFHSFRGSKVMVTYHPAYLLRTTSAKKQAWEDMQMLMKEMGIEIPPSSR